MQPVDAPRPTRGSLVKLLHARTRVWQRPTFLLPAVRRRMRRQIMPQWPKQSECDDFYGDPRGDGDNADPGWDAENLVQINSPWTWILDWDEDKELSKIRIHS